MTAVAASYAAARAVSRAANSSFPLAFRLLPGPQRDAMFALYAFARRTDDIADEPGDPAEKERALDAWERALAGALGGADSDPLHPALRHTSREFGIPAEHLTAIVRGCRTDLRPARFDTFADLDAYCRDVAGAVGLACVRVWGLPDARGDAFAAAAGTAFQITNVLRDLAEDLARGRVYLPAEDIRAFDCPPASWPAGGPKFLAMMRFQADRADDYYRRAEPLAALLPRPGRAVFGLMTDTYRALLAEVRRQNFDASRGRARVPRWRKAALFARAWLRA